MRTTLVDTSSASTNYETREWIWRGKFDYISESTCREEKEVEYCQFDAWAVWVTAPGSYTTTSTASGDVAGFGAGRRFFLSTESINEVAVDGAAQKDSRPSTFSSTNNPPGALCFFTCISKSQNSLHTQNKLACILDQHSSSSLLSRTHPKTILQEKDSTWRNIVLV